MMKIKKIFAIGVILLFIGVAIAPTINFTVVKASDDNDLVEVTTQACGIKGFGNTTVKLTREQYQNLEQYLVEFRARLNQTTTREEAVPIFKEAVVELNKYGLLPKGMSVERAQRLVLGPYHNTKLTRYLEILSDKPENSLVQDGNKFCLISGEARGKTNFQGPVNWAIYNILYGLYNLFLHSGYNPEIFLLLSMLLAGGAIATSNYKGNLPYVGAFIYYGEMYGDYSGTEYYPAEGSLWTNGLYHNKQWYGPFYGNLSSPRLSTFFTDYYPGTSGFTGLKLFYNSSVNYFGFALNVNVCPEPP